MKKWLFNFLVLIGHFCPVFASQDVWLDYDLGLGKMFHDVDDGYALAHLISAEDKLNIEGISLVYGNTSDLNHQYRWTYKIYQKFKRFPPQVFHGAKGIEHRRDTTEASIALINVLEKKKIKILATGRLSNIATVLALRPDLASSIDSVIVNAGRKLAPLPVFGRAQVQFPDTNVDDDPEAFEVLHSLNVKVVMIPVESMTSFLWTRKEIKKMKKLKGGFSWLGKKSRTWEFLWNLWPGASGFIPWDLLAAAYLTNENFYSCLNNIPYNVLTMKNTTSPLFKNKKYLKYKKFLVADQLIKSKSKGVYCYDIDLNLKEELFARWSNFSY